MKYLLAISIVLFLLTAILVSSGWQCKDGFDERAMMILLVAVVVSAGVSRIVWLKGAK